LASFSYEHPIQPYSSFTGFGVFNNGRLDGGPALIIRGDGAVYHFSNMIQGIPCGFGTLHFSDHTMINTTNLSEKSDVGGLL